MKPGTQFLAPDLSAPLDLAAHLALAPRDGTVKGMFFRKVLDETRAVTGRSLRDGSYLQFRDYPLADWLILLHEAARYAYPKLPMRAGLKQLGRSMYPTLADSMVGRVVLSVAAGNLVRALPVYPRLWSLISNHASAEVDELTPGRVVIRLRNAWDFLDSFEFGALAAGMGLFGIDAHVKVALLGPCDADYEVTWVPA
ncbi:MAG: DUF2378 family protein [Deltaproteobacteria bacterium]